MNADEFNTRYPVGTRVAAYPGTRNDAPLITRTRSEAWTLGHDAPVVAVERYTGGIMLTHVDAIEGGNTGRPVAERRLTRTTIDRIADRLDLAGVFTKDYTRYVDGRLKTVGLRIGEKPRHVVAFFGDTIIWHADGAHTVRHADEAAGGAS